MKDKYILDKKVKEFLENREKKRSLERIKEIDHRLQILGGSHNVFLL